jgi:FecR protein
MQSFWKLIAKRVTYLVIVALIATISLHFWLQPVKAQSVLNRAQLYKLKNQVELNRQNQGSWSVAKVGQTLVPQDSLRTGNASRAELLFNEGTLVRTGANTVFRFPKGKRRFELSSGSALVMIRPGMGQSNIITPQASIVSQGTALFVQHDRTRNASLIGVLTNSLAGPVTVLNNNGRVAIELRAGQFVSVINGVVGLVENFILPVFYDTIELAYGLGTGQQNLVAQESAEVQTTLNLIQNEAFTSLQSQVAWLNGLCGLNINLQQLTPLMQWILPGAVPANPGEQVVRSPQTDLFVTPMRSLNGLVWLGNYCQSNNRPAPNIQVLPGQQPIPPQSSPPTQPTTPTQPQPSPPTQQIIPVQPNQPQLQK